MKLEYLAPDGCHYSSKKDYFWISELNFCGCYSNTLFDLAFKILENLYRAKKAEDSWYYEYKDASGKDLSTEYTDLQELILFVLDSKEITEHGGSVRGSWLTEKGLKLCTLLFEENKI